MNKTNVDSMLIEMITPKVKQIEEKFGNGEGLTQDDINTLLLKSQYNHINHLDIKLDEVVADVASLKDEFNGLKGEFNGLKGEFNAVKAEFNGLKGEFNGLKGEFNTLKAEFNGLKAEFDNLKSEFQSFKNEINTRFDLMEEKIEHNIQKSLNKNMVLLVVVMGGFLTLSKIIDKF